MALILYELRDAADRPTSPYSWRIRESLLLLSVPFRSRLLNYAEIHRRFTGPRRTIPVIEDGAAEIGGSWAIAEHLARHHDPDKLLFGGDGGRSLTYFVTNWVDATVMGPLNRMMVKDIHDGVSPADQAYFRRVEEERQGRPLEEVQAARDVERPEFQRALHPARRAIKEQSFLGGEDPTYADFALHAAFHWARLVTDFEPLRPDDRIHEWLRRMDDWLGARPAVPETIGL